MGKRVLITGGAGFIGRSLVSECLKRDHHVTVLDSLVAHRSKKFTFADPRVVFIRADIRGRGVLPSGEFDYVFHLAAEPFVPTSFTKQSHVWDVNATGTLNILQSSLRWQAERVLVISSSEVYGTAQEKPMSIKHPVNPQSTYAVSKLAAEKLAVTMHHELGVPAIVLRPFNTYGPGTLQPYVIPEIIAQAHRGDVIQLGNADSVRDFTYVADMAWIIAELIERGTVGETYHYGSGRTISIREIVKLIEVITGKLLTIAQDESRIRPNDVTWLEANSEQIRSIMPNIPPAMPIEAGIRAMLAEFEILGYRWPWE